MCRLCKYEYTIGPAVRSSVLSRILAKAPLLVCAYKVDLGRLSNHFNYANLPHRQEKFCLLYIASVA